MKLNIKEYLEYEVNIASLALFLLFVFGLSANLFYVIYFQDINVVSVLISILLYNTAFTIWHEAAHNNIFRGEKRYLNKVVGVVTSFFNLNPVFFNLKHDHLLHHTNTLDEEKDRTFLRVAKGVIAVPLGIVLEMLTRKDYSLKYGLKRKNELLIDKASFIILALSIFLLIFFGYGLEFLLTLFLPRLIILPIHTTYVCYLPHAGLPVASENSTRNLLVPKFLKYLILFHNYHGVHHITPSIPWNKYEKCYKSNKTIYDSKLARSEDIFSLFKNKLLKN